MWNSVSFSEKELACRCTECAEKPIPVQWRERIFKTVAALEVIRSFLNQPVQITSGLRCKAHNEAIGGGASSKHLFGQAVDITTKGWPGERLRGLLEALITLGKISEGGLGTYHDKLMLLHYDTRGVKARWVK